MGFGQGAAENREVLAEDEDGPPVDRAMTGDDAIGQDALVVQPKSVERWVTKASSSTNESVVEQQVEPLARRELALSCCCAMRASPPPSRDATRSRRSSSIRSRLVGTPHLLASLRKDTRRARTPCIVARPGPAARPGRMVHIPRVREPPTRRRPVHEPIGISTKTVNNWPRVWITGLVGAEP